MTETTDTDDRERNAPTTDRAPESPNGGPAVSDGGVDSSDATHTADSDSNGPFVDADFQRTLQGGAIVVLGLLATWATFQAYASASAAIGIWISQDFVPVFEAAFNVAVVFVALAGIVWLARRFTEQ